MILSSITQTNSVQCISAMVGGWLESGDVNAGVDKVIELPHHFLFISTTTVCLCAPASSPWQASSSFASTFGWMAAGRAEPSSSAIGRRGCVNVISTNHWKSPGQPRHRTRTENANNPSKVRVLQMFKMRRVTGADNRNRTWAWWTDDHQEGITHLMGELGGECETEETTPEMII